MPGQPQQLPGPVPLLLCVRGLQRPREEHAAVQEQQDCGEDEGLLQLHEILQEEQVVHVGQWKHAEQQLLVKQQRKDSGEKPTSCLSVLVL